MLLVCHLNISEDELKSVLLGVSEGVRLQFFCGHQCWDLFLHDVMCWAQRIVWSQAFVLDPGPVH